MASLSDIQNLMEQLEARIETRMNEALAAQRTALIAELVNLTLLQACFLGLQTVRPDQRPFGKFTESMPIWYLKRLENYEDHGTGPELPEKPPERRISKLAGPGGSGRRTRRLWPPAPATRAAIHGSSGL
ncbi:hypothetical protein JCGZ_15257 [Jatropha curcas]|uniref:Uncharacterized protein n=1 Tax=Jatropha curcas TaxID=180498 RepID=A0A067K673_JATCU|nr:hypothetical protein JCGZ_15257 [Jatropha curcas]